MKGCECGTYISVPCYSVRHFPVMPFLRRQSQICNDDEKIIWNAEWVGIEYYNDQVDGRNIQSKTKWNRI